MTVLPCIVCQRALSDIGSGSDNHANDANEFRAHGQYGSRVFDPVDGTYLAVNICDDCITQAGRAGQVLEGDRERKMKPWTPEVPTR